MITAVVVTYHPGDVSSLLAEFARQCDGVIVVDNGSDPAEVEALRGACDKTGSELVELGTNLGIAAAQNRGIELAKKRTAGSPESSYVLLSDQDSMPAPDMVAKLLEAIEEDPAIAAVGPLPSEDREGADELVYVDRGWAPKRASKAELKLSRVNVAFLIASGCLIRLAALESVGKMREDLFIDHVDLEWGMRARKAGWRLVAVPEARLNHSLGDDVVRLPGRDQPVHVHSPIRNYYILRNTIALVRSDLFPGKWRIRYCYWAAKYVAFNAFAAGEGKKRRRMLRKAAADGFRGKLGPLAD